MRVRECLYTGTTYICELEIGEQKKKNEEEEENVSGVIHLFHHCIRHSFDYAYTQHNTHTTQCVLYFISFFIIFLFL